MPVQELISRYQATVAGTAGVSKVLTTVYPTPAAEPFPLAPDDKALLGSYVLFCYRYLVGSFDVAAQELNGLTTYGSGFADQPKPPISDIPYRFWLKNPTTKQIVGQGLGTGTATDSFVIHSENSWTAAELEGLELAILVAFEVEDVLTASSLQISVSAPTTTAPVWYFMSVGPKGLAGSSVVYTEGTAVFDGNAWMVTSTPVPFYHTGSLRGTVVELTYGGSAHLAVITDNVCGDYPEIIWKTQFGNNDLGGWSTSGSTSGIATTMTKSRSGSYSVELGVTNIASDPPVTSILYRTVTLPDNACSFVYWVAPRGASPTNSPDLDFQFCVRQGGTGGAIILGPFANWRNIMGYQSEWWRFEADLSEFAGTTVTLEFTVVNPMTTYWYAQSGVYLDDLTLYNGHAPRCEQLVPEAFYESFEEYAIDDVPWEPGPGTPTGTGGAVIVEKLSPYNVMKQSAKFKVYKGNPITHFSRHTPVVIPPPPEGGDGRIYLSMWVYLEFNPATQGISSGANSSSTLNDTSQTWVPNAYVGKSVTIIAGTGFGQTAIITASSATQLTILGSWTTTPDASSRYMVFSGWPNNQLSYITLNSYSNPGTVVEYVTQLDTGASIRPRLLAMSGYWQRLLLDVTDLQAGLGTTPIYLTFDGSSYAGGPIDTSQYMNLYVDEISFVPFTAIDADQFTTVDGSPEVSTPATYILLSGDIKLILLNSLEADDNIIPYGTVKFSPNLAVDTMLAAIELLPQLRYFAFESGEVIRIIGAAPLGTAGTAGEQNILVERNALPRPTGYHWATGHKAGEMAYCLGHRGDRRGNLYYNTDYPPVKAPYPDSDIYQTQSVKMKRNRETKNTDIVQFIDPPNKL